MRQAEGLAAIFSEAEELGSGVDLYFSFFPEVFEERLVFLSAN